MICQPSSAGTSLGSEACWMLRATLSSCSMRSRSILSCSRSCSLSVAPIVPILHSSATLPSTMRWMTMTNMVISLPVGGRRKAHKLPSIVGGVHDEAGNHLVVRGYLVLDEYAGVGESSSVLSDRAFCAFAAGLFAGKQFGVVDEVGGHHLVHRIQIPLDPCLQETPSQCRVLFNRHRSTSLPT